VTFAAASRVGSWLPVPNFMSLAGSGHRQAVGPDWGLAAEVPAGSELSGRLRPDLGTAAALAV